MALVIVTYYALYTPAMIDSFIDYNVCIQYYVSNVVNLLFFTNALINPFIYSRQSVEFNFAYRKILRINRKITLRWNRVGIVPKMGRPIVYCVNPRKIGESGIRKL